MACVSTLQITFDGVLVTSLESPSPPRERMPGCISLEQTFHNFNHKATLFQVNLLNHIRDSRQ